MIDLKRALRDRSATFGSWLCLGDSTVAEIMADAGFDWLVIDLEHSPITLREAADMIRVIDLKGVVPLVRLTSNDANQAKRVLDAGAHGIVVPMVKSAAEAREAVDAVYYPPRGQRGVGLGRAHGYGARFPEYLEWLGANAVVIAQIEHFRAVDELEGILATDGIDGTIIGPYDLSASVGKPGAFDDPAVQPLLRTYRSVSADAGKATGIHIVRPDGAAARATLGDGYSFVALGVDYLYVGESCRRELGLLRGGT
jgi:2-dehydro-3-deoxyglucarate aldolase